MEASLFFMFSRVMQQVQNPGLNGNGNMRKPSELYCEITINIFGIGEPAFGVYGAAGEHRYAGYDDTGK